MMPYSIQKRGSMWCVIKDSDGSSVGCHNTESEARAQITAVSISEGFAIPEKYEDINFSLPDGARDAAKRALEWIAEGKAGRGFTDTGRARASDLSSDGYKPSPDVVRRMKSYFDRHQSDKDASGFKSGEEGYPSPGRVAWDAWGGDAGYAYARRVVSQMDTADKSDMRLIHRYGAVDGDWVRILPIGSFKRFGRSVHVTADKIIEMARNFGHVPDTAIPVNAEHKEFHGKMADVLDVSVHNDGLWAKLGNWVGDAADKVNSGAFQYVSPEIVWGPTDYDGIEVSNVLVGLALTNLPYFGKRVALYQLNGDDFMDEYPMDAGNSNIIMALLDALLKAVGAKKEMADVEDEPVMEGDSFSVVAKLDARSIVDSDEYRAIVQENEDLKKRADEYKAAAEKIKLDAARAERVAKYASARDVHERLPEILADCEDQESASLVLERLSALTAQVEFSGMFDELGRDGGGQSNNDAVAVFEASISKKTADGMNYSDAAQAVAREKPELYEAYRAELGGK